MIYIDLHYSIAPKIVSCRRFIIIDICRLFKRDEEITYDIRVICIDVNNYRWLDDPIYHIVLKSPFFLSGICWWCLACRIFQILVGRKSVCFSRRAPGFACFPSSQPWLVGNISKYGFVWKLVPPKSRAQNHDFPIFSHISLSQLAFGDLFGCISHYPTQPVPMSIKLII